jgi:hypothetical protein
MRQGTAVLPELATVFLVAGEGAERAQPRDEEPAAPPGSVSPSEAVVAGAVADNASPTRAPTGVGRRAAADND